MGQKRQISHAEIFQLIYAATPPSRKESLIPHSLHVGGYTVMSSQEHSMGKPGERETFHCRNLAKAISPR